MKFVVSSGVLVRTDFSFNGSAGSHRCQVNSSGCAYRMRSRDSKRGWGMGQPAGILYSYFKEW